MRRALLLWSLPLATPALAAMVAHCGARDVNAVDFAGTTDGAGLSIRPDTGTGADTGPDDGPLIDAAGQPSESGTLLGWPNSTSYTNSDRWIVANHDSIVQMQPRLLVLDFYNPWDVSLAQARVQDRIDAIAESSRYHGYADQTAPTRAPAFLNYVLVKPVVDLTDHPAPANWNPDSSMKLPTDGTGTFNTNGLFTSSFAANFGFLDPATSQYLTLCQLFEQGIINELWLMTGDEGSSRRPPLTIESKQVYDSQNRAIDKTFATTTGEATFAPPCGVTTRIAFVSPTRAVDCDLLPRSAAIEKLVASRAIPQLSDYAGNFFNSDFTKTYGTPFNSWTDLVSMGSTACSAGIAAACGWCQSQQSACISYPSDTTAAGTYPPRDGGAAGGTWQIPSFRQGCGTTRFPPSARFEWDYANSQPVSSRCEHYGMRDADGGVDTSDRYTSTKASVATYTQQYCSDGAPSCGCGGGWQVYYRQNMPGLNNHAYATDGSPMKNWWPYLFY